MKLGEWLRAGQRFFSAEDLAPLRHKAAQQLRSQRTEALNTAAALEAEIAELTGTTTPSLPFVPAAAPRLVRAPESDARGEAALPELVSRIITERPGLYFAEILDAVLASQPNTTAKTLHTTVYRLSKGDDARVIKAGTRGQFRYYPREKQRGSS